MFLAVFLEDVKSIGRIFKNIETNNRTQTKNKLIVTMKNLFFRRFVLKVAPPLFHITKKRKNC